MRTLLSNALIAFGIGCLAFTAITLFVVAKAVLG